MLSILWDAKRVSTLATIAFLAGSIAARAADAGHPTVVELYQSQDCASCLPANTNLLAIADRPDVLALSLDVTYWDHLGWKDTFAKPAFTKRQWDYARALHHKEVWTPQIVINGAVDIIGNRRDELDAAIRHADRGDAGPTITIAPGKVTISGAASAASADVVLVRYDPRIVQVAIGAGENEGTTIPHRNVVHDVQELGDWDGGDATFNLPDPGDAALKTAILIQQGRGGPIIAAAHN
jgi:hypothetical protein